MTHREIVKNWRAQHKAKGLCRDCIAPVKPGNIRCEFHLKEDSRSTQKLMRVKRPIWKIENKCTACGNPLEETGYTQCVNCRDIMMREVRKLGTFNEGNIINA